MVAEIPAMQMRTSIISFLEKVSEEVHTYSELTQALNEERIAAENLSLLSSSGTLSKKYLKELDKALEILAPNSKIPIRFANSGTFVNKSTKNGAADSNAKLEEMLLSLIFRFIRQDSLR